MADKKISELVSASTPLSGTETIPIVQGGVTKKATPGNMTLGQSINPFSITVSSSTPTITLNDTDAGHQTTFQEVGSNFELWSKNGVARIYVGGSKIEALQAQADGDILCPSGNFVVGTAGKGIDFSADGNAAGMTSELLDDYEEGTFNPTFTTDGVNFDSVTYDALTSAKYVKIGLMVHVQIMIRTDNITVGSATGNVRIGGLPFTASSGVQADSSGELTVGQASSWAGDVPFSAEVVSGSTTARLWYRTSVNGATTATAIADLGTGADTNLIRCSGSYIAA